MANRSDDGRKLPRAGEHELHQDAPPPRADAFDQMGRRYSDTVKNPEQPTNIAPVEEHEGHHADPAEGRPPIDDGIAREEMPASTKR